MNTLNTIIEEEKKKAHKKLYNECGWYLNEKQQAAIYRIETVIDNFLTSAMQRAYEAGKEGCDTYWKERVYGVVSEWVTHNAKTIQHNNGATEYIEVRELLTLLGHLEYDPIPVVPY